MKHVVGSFEAKTHFSKLLAEVSRGEKILITKNGKVVAMLVPVEKERGLSIDQALDRLRNLRKRISGSKITLKEIDEMKNKGRK